MPTPIWPKPIWPLIETAPSDTAIRLARMSAAITAETIPAAVIAQAQAVIRDVLGVILAGSRLAEIQGLIRLAPALGAGDCTLIGSGATAAPHIAALVNGAGGISLEMGEGNQFAVNHPSMHVLPTVLAAAEETGASGAAMLEAFVVGYETAVWVGRATKIREAVHPFGTHSIVGAAVGAARLYGLDQARTAGVIELAAGLCIASSQQAANTGASARNLFTGFTNHNALLSIKLAEAGFRGEPGALESVFGRILGDGFDLQAPPADQPYYLLRNYFKPHACSRWNHAPIDATASILAERAIDPQAVRAVVVHTFANATRLNATTVANGYGGKHSIPYNVAARLLHGDNGPQVYTDAVARDPRMVALMGKVSVVEDPALTALTPDVRAARVQIVMASGETYGALCERPLGGFDNPMSEADLAAKFRRLAGEALAADTVTALEAVVAALPSAPDLRVLGGLLRP